MQNKGFVKVFAVLLTLVCVFYLSFSFVVRYQTNKAEEMGPVAGQQYLDSLNNTKFWLGSYTLKQCQEMEIGLGLDLKGGMNVILEVSVPDVIKSLADNNPDPAFNKAVAQADKEAESSQDDFLTLFIRDYKQLKPGARLAELFATQEMKGKITNTTSDKDVQKALEEEIKSAVQASYNVLSTRIDRFGVVQPNIQMLEGGRNGRIMVEMPGIKDPDRVRKLLQGSANLEFWETYDGQTIAPLLMQADSKLKSILAAQDSAKATPAKAAAQPKETEKGLAAKLKQQQGGADAAKAEADDAAKKANPLASILQISGQSGCIVGYANFRDTAQVNKYLAMKEVKDALPTDLALKWGVKPASQDKSGQIFELYAIRVTTRDGKAPLEGGVITTAKADYDQNGRPAVSMQMNSEGSREWAALTKANIGKSIAIVLDGYVYSAPNVQNEIDGGSSSITGNFTVEDTKDLANVLNTGKMPAPSHIVQEEIIGPSLGQASINQGITSCIVAFVVLMLFMCVMYGFIPGMIANMALVLNFFFTLGILTSFQAALTMSGIAGMVLSLGIAVDANVLIYERTKEEMFRNGLGARAALRLGYKHAFSAIFDSNLTSIITAFILFEFGTGPIRGFATTLMIGILASFFTSVWITRLVYEHFMNKEKLLNLTFTTGLTKNLMRDPHVKFMQKRHLSISIFVIALLVAVGSLCTRGLSKSIDFTGGRNYVVVFEQPVEPETVRNVMEKEFGPDCTVNALAIGTDHKTIRISTNYRINENNDAVDSEVEAHLFNALKNGNLLGKQVTLQKFKDRDDRAGGSIISSQKVGPSVAEDTTYSAIVSVILALVAIFFYILLRFRNVAYSVGAAVALAIDTMLIIGVYSLCWGWMPFSLEVDQTFIGAVLTAIGYSINDKVVIFDRIREYFHNYPDHKRLELFNDSLNTTLGRTINTSLATLVVLLCIFFLGGESIRSFSFAMILGVIIGTLSSIFMAAPVAYLVMNKEAKKKELKAEVVAE